MNLKSLLYLSFLMLFFSFFFSFFSNPRINRIECRCILSYLRSKTVILVTHQLQFIKKASKILILKEGKQLAFDSYNQIINSGIDLVTMLHKADPKESNNTDDSTMIAKAATIIDNNFDINNKSISNHNRNDMMRSDNGPERNNTTSIISNNTNNTSHNNINSFDINNNNTNNDLQHCNIDQLSHLNLNPKRFVEREESLNTMISVRSRTESINSRYSIGMHSLHSEVSFLIEDKRITFDSINLIQFDLISIFLSRFSIQSSIIIMIQLNQSVWIRKRKEAVRLVSKSIWNMLKLDLE